ncbi:MAG: gamma carbonic anhydrase family protein [Cytophagales bacterium]|nr:MAG: gamma carbonic anhydrase family protein [Cytophagales bacterium]TAF59426.1 MAG: gamma carbonic anhydrase family protein [Cytophagales bacterium]
MALVLPVLGKFPVFGANCFLAPNATIVGDVQLGENCSVWFNAVIRGDVNSIKIGHHTNIQDGAIIHCTYQTASTQIGNYVSIGHAALIHGCTIHDNTLIGMRAIVMDGAVIESGSIVAAGAVVLENTRVESGFIYAGMPARKVKQVAGKAEMLGRIAQNYVMYASWFEQPDSSQS